ncbi:conserved hypothetical protein [Ixodes scapularis]|uniref:Methyltransferase domain-containing protein n=1 Tax=Ixodes scapularis TaxID=6945 RepID=B7PAI2_IXOSC|nr:conserved hypothetical protein [Ixodes scapularis]|eukprot:XP_002406867.1 conserved hypothetical protein [Ixodes scapularis]
MNLLPKTSSEFASEKYWNEFFQKRGKAAFEWYGEYWQLCGTLYKYLKKSDKLLVVGCGNSSLSADLYDSGYTSNVSIDISKVVIQQMIEKYGETRPHMQFHQMDASKMEYADEEFSVVVDKGTVDALTPNKDADTVFKLSGVFGEISRVLRVGGRFICISLLQRHVLETLLECTTWTWVVRIHRCIEAEKMDDPETTGLVLPVFIVVFTKLKRLPGLETVMELAFDPDSKPVRVPDLETVYEEVSSIQKYAFLRYHIAKRYSGDDVRLDLCTPDSNVPRYQLYVCDRPSCRILTNALLSSVLRETEWLFGNTEGRRQLAESCSAERLVVVHLSRGHSYSGLEQVKTELSQKVMELAPASHTTGKQVPFLSTRDNVGHREVRHSGTSALSGDYLVEDVSLDGDVVVRRLIFLDKPHVVQSEARLKQGGWLNAVSKQKQVEKKKKVKSKKKGRSGNKTFEVDVNHLCCEYYKYMVAGLAFVMPRATEHKATALLVGLGGGTLSMFLTTKFPKLVLSVVELDPAVVDVARKWYLPPNCPIDITIDDGLCALKNNSVIAGKVFDVIFLDVDSKDLSKGLTCPPASFLEEAALKCLAAITAPTGKSSFSVVNFVCRNEALKSDVYESLKLHFSSVLVREIPDDVNEVLYLKHKKQALDGGELLGSLKTLNNLIRDSENSNDILDLFGELKIS